jgi:type I restriction enzyme R subunit
MDRDETLEKKFESDIEQWLLTEGGYVKGDQKTYDKEQAIDLDTLVSFITQTQPKAWERFVRKYGDRAKDQLFKTFQDDVVRYGLIYVLRNGIDDFGIKLKLCYFAPASELNEELVKNYQQNILTCTRQFAYSTRNHNTIDMVLSLNGIPVVALELKNQLTNQCLQDSLDQWRNNRNPKEELFHFNNRILAYFGVDLYEAAVSTELKGEKTYFIPFNQGSNGAGKVGGAGNPQAPEGEYVTGYLWKKVLRRDMLLAILQRFVMVQEENEIKIIVDKHGREKEVTEESRKLIFPRFHQLDVVEKLVADTTERGSGHNYLIQHSAGSGKSNSIAWLTYRLASLHNRESVNVFDGVFVVTDRRVLNRQLQNTILGFEHIEGTVETITDKDNSEKLKKVIDDGVARIIITTLHRFPIIWNKLQSRKGKRYAIIVDEAHSSQSGKSAEKLKAALADTEEALKEMAEIEEKTEEELEQEMDAMMLDLLSQGQHNNLSFYAFTATPKPKTLQTFGVLVEKGKTPEDDKYAAFHNYSMLQAIEEGFIKDVLKNYTTFETSYEIAKRVEDNPEYEETPATRALKIFHDDHTDTINKKTRIIVEKFREVTLTHMGGKAKAMVVTSSRAHALRYYFAIKQYCAANGIDTVHPMVAFSGKVKYGDKEYTETMLNSTEERKISEDRLPLYFASELYNMLIVADKYQTGFDEPQLHTMFVDKRLKTVKAVQTLSRLNRWHKDKKDTFVFDFVNDTEDIKKSFEPFYKSTELINPVDVNYVYTFRKDIEQYHLWTIAEEEAFYKIIGAIKAKKGESRLAALSNALKPVVDRFQELDEEKRFEARSKIKNFVRFYAYMAQIARTFDKALYKAYVFADYLYRVLPKTPHEKVDLNKKVLLLNSRIDQGETVSITLGDSDPIKGENPKGGIKPTDKRDLLSNIIDKVNLMFQGNFTPEDRVMVEGIFDRLKKTADSRIRRQANNNDENQFVDSIFPQIFNEAAQDCYTNQTDAYRKLFKNQDFYNQIMQQMGRAMYEHYRAQQEQAYTIANLRTKMLAKIKPEFSVITNSARTVEEAFDWTMKIIHDKSNEKYAGLEDIVLSSLYKLYCSTQPLSLSDKRTFLRNIVTSYESYLKKLYLMIEHKEVTDKNGSAEYAALSNAIYCLKALNQLKYNHDEESDKFSDYLDILVSLRNAENHSGIAIQENEVDLGIHIVSTMYLYVTYRYITELEMN